MVRRASVQNPQMNIRPRGLRKSLEKILHQLRLKLANPRCRKPRLHHAVRPPAKIDRRHAQRFVHRHQKVSRAINAALVAQRSN